jgi:hypothetical protein
MRTHRPIFTAGPWHSDWGAQDEPREVSGIQVARELLRGRRGALVQLADGRFALTGTTYAAGTARALKRHLRRRSRLVSEDDRAWLSIVIEELGRRPSPASSPPLRH